MPRVFIDFEIPNKVQDDKIEHWFQQFKNSKKTNKL